MHDPAAAPDAALTCRGVDFSYGRVQVLYGIDLAVHRGETVALLGSNGAGKSTLLRVAAGLDRPDRGSVLHGGVDVTHMPAEQRMRRGIVELVGGAATFGPLTILENLRAATYRYPRRDARSRMDRVLERFPMLAERRVARAADLSGGQQHLLALAIALVHDPDVLLVDELSLGLAPLMVEQVVGIVRELRAQGLTMVIVEQSVAVALDIADRAVFMEKGEVRFDGASAELAERSDLLRAAFLGA